MKILESYKKMVNSLLLEIDDEKMIKYRDKDGESEEMKAGSAKTMPDEHPAKQAWQKMSDAEKGGDDSEKDDDKLGGDDFERNMDPTPGTDDDKVNDAGDEDDDIEISDSNSGPIDRDDILDMLNKDSEIVDKMGDDVYWDGMDLVSSKFDDDTIASIPDDANMTLGDLKKQIMDYEEDMDETKTINGVKYRAIKESKKSNKHILKENYDRFFGDK